MPPALKVLSLVTTILCVVLFFGIFVLDDHITYSNNYPKFSFKPSTKRKTGIATSSLVTNGGITQQTSSSTSINLVPLLDEGTYFTFLADATATVETSSFERLGGDYYKDNNEVYYLLQPHSTCGDAVNKAVTKLDVSLPERITEAQWGNFITDGKDIYLYFLKLIDADQKTFSYVGFAHHGGNELDEVSTYWYKDKNKVFSFIKKVEGCSGVRVYEDKNPPIKDVDVSTFEYIGSQSRDQNAYYAKDQNYFYNHLGKVSDTITPKNCTGDFWKECVPKIQAATRSSSTPEIP